MIKWFLIESAINLKFFQIIIKVWESNSNYNLLQKSHNLIRKVNQSYKYTLKESNNLIDLTLNKRCVKPSEVKKKNLDEK